MTDHLSIPGVVFIKKTLRRLWWLMTLRDNFWARELAHHHVCPRGAAIGANGNLYVKTADLSLPKSPVSRVLLENFDRSERLCRAGVSFNFQVSGRPIVEVDGIRFLLSYAQDLQIIEEVFLDRIYDVAVQEAAVVVDIGMNVAVASLFFARQGFRVFAYEPFRQTFKRATENLSLNPHLSQQVFAHQFGLGGERRVITAAYSAEFSGDCDVFGTPQSFPSWLNEVVSEEINIEPVDQVLDQILAQVGPKSIIMKIDCEGSEYAILERLQNSGMLNRVSIFMIEWHRRVPSHDPARLMDILVKGGFVTFGRGDTGKEVGMIIAVLTSKV